MTPPPLAAAFDSGGGRPLFSPCSPRGAPSWPPRRRHHARWPSLVLGGLPPWSLLGHPQRPGEGNQRAVCWRLVRAARGACGQGRRGRPRRGLQGRRRAQQQQRRLKDAEPVSYVEIHTKKEKDFEGGSCFSIEEGCKEEVYTEEHEKLLGTCETPWTLFVDGYGKDGKRIYDQVRGQTCHQCRQKTLGHHTKCCKCQIVQGQFCGDCLYMRYGENVLEAKSNPNWTCPVCRGICNCSICRTKKGWFPTGNAYRKVVSLGYKSVAHYLIETQRSSATSGDSSSADSSNELPSSKSETSSSVFEHAPVVKEGLKDADLSSKLMNDVGEIDRNKGNEKPAAKDEAKTLGKITDACKDADLSNKLMNEVGEIDQNKGNEKPAVKDEAKALGKITDICKDGGRNESVLTFDSLECQASQDIGCVTPSKPERKKRKLIERSPDCVASRLRSRSAKS